MIGHAIVSVDARTNGIVRPLSRVDERRRMLRAVSVTAAARRRRPLPILVDIDDRHAARVEHAAQPRSNASQT